MIYGRLENLFTSGQFSGDVRLALAYLKETDLSNLEKGKHTLNGDRMFIVVSEYDTENPDESKAEVHKRYIDVQYIIEGRESIGVAPLSPRNKLIKSYDAEGDFELYGSLDHENKILMHKGDCAVFFPSDVHRPNCHYDGKTIGKVRKAVVKVLVEENKE